MTTLGSCLIANEPTDLGKMIMQMRADDWTWKEIGDELNIGGPSAARARFTKETGITDYKTKGPAIWNVQPSGPLGVVPKKPKGVPKSKVWEEPKPVSLNKALGGVADDVDIIKLHEQGKTYTEIKNLLDDGFHKTLSIGDIDKAVFSHLVEQKGSVAKAFKLKPTSETAQATLRNIIDEARKAGNSWDNIAKGMNLPTDMVKQLHNGSFHAYPGAPSINVGWTPPPKPLGPPVYDFHVGGEAIHVDPDIDFQFIDRSTMNNLYPMSGMDPDAKSALYGYTGHEYLDINSALRGKGGQFASQTVAENKARKIDRAMMPAPRNFRVVRQVGHEAFSAAPGSSLAHLQGTPFADPGFLSTTIRPSGSWSGSVRMEIEVTKGTPSRWVGQFSQHKNEEEVVLGRGVNIVITKVIHKKGTYGQGEWIVHGRTVP